MHISVGFIISTIVLYIHRINYCSEVFVAKSYGWHSSSSGFLDITRRRSLSMYTPNLFTLSWHTSSLFRAASLSCESFSILSNNMAWSLSKVSSLFCINLFSLVNDLMENCIWYCSQHLISMLDLFIMSSLDNELLISVSLPWLFLFRTNISYSGQHILHEVKHMYLSHIHHHLWQMERSQLQLAII